MTISPLYDRNWPEIEAWWIGMGERLQVADRAQSFFKGAASGGLLDRIAKVGGQVDYILFVLMRYWVPTVLPPAGRERLTKNDPDYWLESEQILKAAAARLRELKPLIELLTTPSPLPDAPGRGGAPSPVAELELSSIVEGIAESAGSYGGPDYTSIVKAFDPVPLRQTQPFKHNKKHSAELWVVFLLREHFRSFGLGKDRYWPLVAPLCMAAGILNQSGQAAYSPDELKSWWQKNWPRTYTQLEQKQESTDSSGAAYEQDLAWFQAWINWQRER